MQVRLVLQRLREFCRVEARNVEATWKETWKGEGKEDKKIKKLHSGKVKQT